MQKILILLDTTVLWTDPWLDSPDVRALFTLRNHGVEVLVPSVVLREQEQHVRQEIEALTKETMRSLGKLARLTGLMFPSPFHGIESAAAAKHYAEEIQKRLEAAGAVVLPLPQVLHSELLDRAVQRKRPFSDTGRGYRDTLIWYSAMEAIDKADPGDVVQFICVTNNVADFGDKEGNLHADLLNEVVNRRRDVTLSACLARSVGECWNEQLAWLAPRDQDLEEHLRSGKILEVEVTQWVIRHGAQALAGRSFGGSTTERGVADQFGPVVFAIDKVVSVDSPQARRLPTGEVHARFNAFFNGRCDIYQFRPQEGEEEVELRDPFDDDRDWTEVSTGMGPFQAHFSLLIASDRHTVVASDGQPERRESRKSNGG